MTHLLFNHLACDKHDNDFNGSFFMKRSETGFYGTSSERLNPKACP
jgi:hypothetical protein